MRQRVEVNIVCLEIGFSKMYLMYERSGECRLGDGSQPETYLDLTKKFRGKKADKVEYPAIK